MKQKIFKTRQKKNFFLSPLKFFYTYKRQKRASSREKVWGDENRSRRAIHEGMEDEENE